MFYLNYAVHVHNFVFYSIRQNHGKFFLSMYYDSFYYFFKINQNKTAILVKKEKNGFKNKIFFRVHY